MNKCLSFQQIKPKFELVQKHRLSHPLETNKCEIYTSERNDLPLTKKSVTGGTRTMEKEKKEKFKESRSVAEEVLPSPSWQGGSRKEHFPKQ